MPTTLKQRVFALFITALLLATIYFYEFLVHSHIPSDIAAFALPFDMMLFAPALFYVLIVRRKGITPLAVIPVAYFGFAMCLFLIPEANRAFTYSFAVILLVAEAAIVTREVRRFITIFRETKRIQDPIDRYESAFSSILGSPKAGRAMASEVAMWHYALRSWRKEAKTQSGSTYTYHDKSGYMQLATALLVSSPIELICAHLLISQWSTSAAIAITVISVYSIAWLAGDMQASKLRPVRTSDNTININVGLRLSLSVNRSEIAQVSLTEPQAVKDGSIPKKLISNQAMMAGANVWIVLEQPVHARTLFGMRKQIQCVALTLDNPRAFFSDITS